MPKSFQCHVCHKLLTRSTVLQDHLRAHRHEKPFSCAHPGCGRLFTRRPDLLEHRRLHASPLFKCEHISEDGSKIGCNKKFHRKRDLDRHRSRAGGAKCRLIQQSNELDHRPDPTSMIPRSPLADNIATMSAPSNPTETSEQPLEITCHWSSCLIRCNNFGNYILHWTRDHHLRHNHCCGDVLGNGCSTVTYHLIEYLWHCELEHGISLNPVKVHEVLLALYEIPRLRRDWLDKFGLNRETQHEDRDVGGSPWYILDELARRDRVFCDDCCGEAGRRLYKQAEACRDPAISIQIINKPRVIMYCPSRGIVQCSHRVHDLRTNQPLSEFYTRQIVIIAGFIKAMHGISSHESDQMPAISESKMQYFRDFLDTAQIDGGTTGSGQRRVPSQVSRELLLTRACSLSRRQIMQTYGGRDRQRMLECTNIWFLDGHKRGDKWRNERRGLGFRQYP